MTTNKVNKYTVLKYYNDVLKYIEDNILNINETTNIQLNKFRKYINGFIGAYSSDNIPKLKNNESCILNTQTSRQNGEHWIALIKYYNKIYFYDSFGRDYKKLSPLWKTKNWINTHDDGQCIYENTCGQHCLSFILTFLKFHEKCLYIL